MLLGSGPLRGWSFSPGPRDQREKTLRGAFLQLVLYQDAGDEARELELLSWRPAPESPPLANLLAIAILERLRALSGGPVELDGATAALAREVEDLGEDLPGEEAPLEEPAPAAVERLQRIAEAREAERSDPAEKPEPHPKAVALAEAKSKAPAGAPATPPKNDRGPSIFIDPADPQTCFDCGDRVVGTAEVVLGHHDTYRHPYCDLGREDPDAEAELAHRRRQIAEGAAALKPFKARHKGDDPCCELCIKPIKAGELIRRKSETSSKRVHDACVKEFQ